MWQDIVKRPFITVGFIGYLIAGLTGGDDFRLYGGHRLWAWPEVARTIAR